MRLGLIPPSTRPIAKGSRPVFLIFKGTPIIYYLCVFNVLLDIFERVLRWNTHYSNMQQK